MVIQDPEPGFAPYKGRLTGAPAQYETVNRVPYLFVLAGTVRGASPSPSLALPMKGQQRVDRQRPHHEDGQDGVSPDALRRFAIREPAQTERRADRHEGIELMNVALTDPCDGDQHAYANQRREQHEPDRHSICLLPEPYTHAENSEQTHGRHG